MRRVLLATLSLIGMCIAHEKPSKLTAETEKILNELFKEIESSEEPTPFQGNRFFDLEHFLEESSEVEKAYHKLTTEQQEELVEIIDDLNALLAESLKMSGLPTE